MFTQIGIMNAVGCFVAIVGIIWYNSIEYQIKEEKKRQAERASQSSYSSPKSIELESIITSGEKTDD